MLVNKDAWWIVFQELKLLGWRYYLKTAFVVIGLSFWIAWLLESILAGDHYLFGFIKVTYLLDLLFLYLLPLLPFMFRPAQEYFVWLKKNVFVGSRLFIFLRPLPVSLRTLAASRYVFLVVHVLIFVSLLFILLLIWLHTIDWKSSGMNHLSLVLVWMSIGLIIGSLYSACELVYRDNKFVVKVVVYSLLFYSALLLFPVLMEWLLGMGLVQWTIYVSLHHPVLAPCAFLVGAAVSVLLGCWYLHRLMCKTDLLV
ncbi:hypothetical protein J2S00_003984 [Caldalkalibacillus uzonensis]|uniref:ABC transporter permease n=1 Tax=Caldalkalibacillus uzonensis TaxID=353224 RepID=A0ABU0CYC3_9BACI|nr:hypothetical protein [Caldalkalibacillus uzonensis]MDQ0341140.1 hypothetical protein [Caldalkalibacillus uzonensis]